MSDRTIQATTPPSPYEPPTLKVLGTVQALTLQGKTFGTTDGMWLVVPGQPNQGLTNAS